MGYRSIHAILHVDTVEFTFIVRYMNVLLKIAFLETSTGNIARASFFLYSAKTFVFRF